MSRIYAVDIQDQLRLRLIDAPESAIADLQRRLPSAAAGPGDLPALEVLFVETLPLTGPTRPIGRGGHAIVDGGLILGEGPLANSPRSILRFDALPPAHRDDGAPALVCERAVGRVPHLVPLVNIALLGLGVVPLHASAVSLDGSGVVLAGWRKSGKTEAMLALASIGASLVADEWAYLRPDRSVWGLPGPISLAVDRIRELDLAEATIGGLLMARTSAVLARLASRAGGTRQSRAGRVLRRSAGHLEQRATITMSPAALIGGSRIVPGVPLDVAVLMLPTTGVIATVSDVSPAVFAARMVAADVHHRMDLLGLYWLSRFAAPGVTNPIMDDLAGTEMAALTRVLDGVSCLVLEHPLPIDIGAIRNALVPALAAKGIGVAAEGGSDV